MGKSTMDREVVQNLTCVTCTKGFSSKVKLKNHEYNVHKRIKKACNLCNYSGEKLRRHTKLVHLKNFRRHTKSIHSLVKDHSCEECDYKSGLKSNLKKHIQRVHKKEDNIKAVLEGEKHSVKNCQLCGFSPFLRMP